MAIVLSSAVMAGAATFEVGPGRAYSTIQSAVDAAAALDDPGATSNTGQSNPVHIVIFEQAGGYSEVVSIPNDPASSIGDEVFNGANDGWTVRANPTDEVWVNGGFNVGVDRDHVTFDGINVQMSGGPGSGFHFNQTARSCHIKNLVIHGSNNSPAVAGSNLYGWNNLDHVTIYGTTSGISYGYASATTVTNSIIANTVNTGHQSSSASQYSYSDVYGCNPNFNGGEIDSGNNVSWPNGLDPQFLSTNPASPSFLRLDPASPCAGTASSAGSFTNGEFNMGAFPAGSPSQDPGACCLADGSCTETTEASCSGTFQGIGTTCGSVSCPQPPELGACCLADGSCTETIEASCSGTFQGVGTTCASTDCPSPPGCSLELEDALQNVSLTRFPENPIIEPSPDQFPNGMWTDNLHTLHQCVRRKDASSPYMMWYTGDSSADYPRRIHLATSNDGVNFTKYGVVLERTPGNLLYWDGVQVHMPTVIWHNDQWMMWYVGHDNCGCPGWYTVGLATSPDGINWTKYGQVLPTSTDPNAFDYDTIREPTVIFDDSDNLFKMWYSGTVVDQYWGLTGFATSPDGINWTKHGAVGQTPDELRGGAIKIGDYIYMFYNIGPTLGYGVSQNGIDWVHSPANPIMVPQSGTWEHGYLQAPSLVYDPDQNKLLMYYNAFDGANERIGGAWTPFAAITQPPSPFGDFDDDQDVDMEDFGFLQACLDEWGSPQIRQGCEAADLNCDSAVDQNDMSVLKACLSGANVPVDPACVP